jgi:O-antigen ligase
MQFVKTDKALKYADSLDKTILYTGAAIPVGMVVGNVGFEAMIALAGLAWLIRAFLLRENPFSRIFTKPASIACWGLWAWGAWLCCIFLSLSINGPGSKGFWHDIVYLRFFLYACAMIDLSSRKKITNYLLWGLAAGILFAAFNTIMAYGVSFDLFGRTWEEYNSQLGAITRFAAMDTMAAPVFVGWAIAARSERVKYWWLLFIIGGIAALNTIQTEIRTAIVSLFAGVFFVFIYTRYKKMARIEKILWPVLSILAIWLIIKLGEGWSFATIYHRIAIWKVSIAMWADNLWLGVGISSWPDVYSLFASSGKISAYTAPDGLTYALGEASHAHNLFIMLISATGLLGLLSFLCLFACCIAAIIRTSSPWKTGLLSWPIVFMLLGITGWSIYHSSYLALFSFFAVLALTSDVK